MRLRLSHRCRIWPYIYLLLVFGAVQPAVLWPIFAMAAGTTTPAPLIVRNFLLPTPNDALTARNLRLQNPLLSPHQLALKTQISADQHRLILWMNKDLGQYVANHAEVWDRRQRLRPNLVGYYRRDGGDPVEVHVCDRSQAHSALDIFSETMRQSPRDITLADFHKLVSVFAAPDHDPHSRLRRKLDVTDQYGQHEFHGLWPTEAFLFTTQKIGFRRMALSYGLGIHYLGLISHLDLSAAPHGYSMLPCEFLEHALRHARNISHSLSDISADWPVIHQMYERMRDAPGRTIPQRQMDDVVYFFLTHELSGDFDDLDMYGQIAESEEMLPLLEKIAGDEGDWTVMLHESLDRIMQFWMEHVESAKSANKIDHLLLR